MTIEKITDFKEILTEIQNTNSSYSSGNCADLVGRIMHVSEPIINCALIDKTTLGNYSQTCVLIADKIKSGAAVSGEDMDRWNMFSKVALSIAFIQIAVKARNEGTFCLNEDRELDEMLLDYFSGDHITFVAAHYQASQRLACYDPMRCYRNTISDFKKLPELAQNIYSGMHYCYDPEKVNDAIYENCPICGSDKSKPYYCADQALLDHNSFAPAKLWMKCCNCHNLYAYNFPVWNIGEINGHYTVSSEGGILTPRNQLSIYCDIFNNIKEFNDGSKYLEVGVGNGEMLAVALEMGYDVSAVEICREDCENISGALGVDIVWSDFLKFETDKKFDIIIMGDILEHVSKPIDALKKAYDLLDENGILWLSTPNFNSAFTRMRKFSDPMWNQKNHFTYFSYEGLKPFLDNIGFALKRYDVSGRYNGSMELILQKQ